MRITARIILALAFVATFAVGALAQLDSAQVEVPGDALGSALAGVLAIVNVGWAQFLLLLVQVAGVVNTAKALLKNLSTSLWPWINLGTSLAVCLYQLHPNWIGGIVAGILVFAANWFGWIIAKSGATAIGLRTK